MVKTFKVKGGKTNWLRVDRSFPCPICGKTDWCVVNEQQTKAVCMRHLDENRDSYLGGTIYELNNHIKRQVVMDYHQGRKLAPSHILHKVYSLVIATLGITETHAQHLMSERGLTREQIILRGYASTTPESMRNQVASYGYDENNNLVIKTIWEDLFESNGLPRDAWLGVPGFYYATSQNQPAFDTKEGILIPCRNAWGQIVGAQIRVDEDKISYFAKVCDPYTDTYRVSVKKIDGVFQYEVINRDYEVVAQGNTLHKTVTLSNGISFDIKSSPKYLFVSTADKERGTSARSVPHFSFPDNILAQAKFDNEGKSRVPLMKKVEKVIVTEGLLKGDIISSKAPTTRLHKLGSVLVISMPGVSSWKRVAEQILAYQFKEAYLAFDQDFEDNDAVFNRMDDMVQYLTFENNITSIIFTWDTGKGLDDYLLSEAEKTEKLRFRQYKPVA